MKKKHNTVIILLPIHLILSFLKIGADLICQSEFDFFSHSGGNQQLRINVPRELMFPEYIKIFEKAIK